MGKVSRIATVGEFLASGTGLGLHCLDCPRYVEVDLRDIERKAGPDALIVGRDTPFRRSLRCSVCGSHNIQMTVIAPGTTKAGKNLPR